jgi:dUTP pyrophosphatase
MKVRIKRFDKELPLPAYKTGKAAAFDLHARETITIEPRSVGVVPLNVAIETPDDCFLLLASRSSTYKRGLTMANGVGIGDPDYSGDEDQYHAVFLNITDKPVTIERGDRIVQGLFIKKEQAQWEETDELGNKSRGGFGTTGTK